MKASAWTRTLLLPQRLPAVALVCIDFGNVAICRSVHLTTCAAWKLHFAGAALPQYAKHKV